MELSKTLRQHSRPLLWSIVVLVAIVLIVVTVVDQEGVADIGALLLNLCLLGITATTLQWSIPEPGKVWVDPQPELETSDLIFFVVGDSADGKPRDIMLQMHVAVSNVGDRQLILSRLTLAALLDESDCPVDIGMGSIRGHRYDVRTQWLDTHAITAGQQSGIERFTIREETPPPFTLRPDDVATLRLRCRVGIDWTEQWSLKKLDYLGTQLQRPITRARIAVIYRRGREMVTEEFSIPVSVVQQDMYCQALRQITKDFTLRPDLPPEPIPNL